MEKKYDILAIDDEKIILDSIKMIAGSEGFTVDFAMTPDEIHKKIDDNSYRLILSDIMMPEITGFEILEYIAKKELITPVIMTTGYSTTEYAVKSFSLGALEFLPKPFNFDELITGISRGIRCFEFNSKEKCKFDFPPTHKRLGKYCWLDNQSNDGAYKIGVSPMFLKIIGDISSIELLNNGEYITQAASCGKMIAVDGLEHYIPTAFSGRILEINEEVASNFHILYDSPYNNWLYRIIPTDYDYDYKNLT